ncbi:RIC1-domain-containing protein [Trichoderma citrinoviride]|uniref:RIC1-domain-containing protein n=1 Tax=Trichoderma citrinoviride TaxID=58853 RepID=A0A2T4B467_9HYPO|nr:RIC1-domain-containing protein [Trichoderma citrinoviride]PTB64112.1 RIC1-domain-containing protein [Trichoderma citrinoviride]
MYWPIGTPRVHATSSSRASDANIYVSYDGLQSLSGSSLASPQPEASAQAPHDDSDDAQPPPTPVTPATPAVKPVDRYEFFPDGAAAAKSQAAGDGRVPLKDPVLALRIARTGQMFAVITATSITLWQTKPAVVLALVVRSDSSLESYGTNVDLLLRPDSAILVVHTSKGYLITYSIATDGESRVYKPHFSNYHNVQRRKQSLIGPQSHLRPDQILWGPGEGGGVRDVSVRFRMVIKVDAGIESALALDDELVVATRKPAAVQCIRWTPDSSGNQTRTEILSRMGWVEKKASIVEMTHDRPMNLATWITSDGRAYAVQRQQRKNGAEEEPDGADSKRLFKGHCFHIPKDARGKAVRAVINARFSLIAVGCLDGAIHVYSVRDYEGNIVHSHSHRMPFSTATTGCFTTLTYSPDGYCLFAGFEKGWSTFSMFGKLGTNSFGAEPSISALNGEQWLLGVKGAVWSGGGSEILLIGQRHEAIWSLEMAKNAITGCYNEANVFRTVLQTPTSVMIYRGYDLPDLTSISAEPFLWHTSRIPSSYLLNQWPIRQTVISPDGRYVAVAGRRGLAHYSVNSGRWKTFADEVMENSFSVRGGMCWYQHILVAAVEDSRTFELRLYSREAALDNSHVLHTERLPAPVVLVTASGEDSLLVYTYENLLYHYIFVPTAGSVRLIQVGQIAFHGIVRSPARVRGLSWILPDSQLSDGDPSQDVAVASVLFLVDGKLVLLSPSLNDDGQLKYDMRIIAQNVEYHVSMRDQPPLNVSSHYPDEAQLRYGPPALRDSLWLFDGMEIKAWTDIHDLLTAASGDGGTRELPTPVSVDVDFYPLSILLEKGIVLGVESDLVQRRDVAFSFFHFAIRTHLVLPDVLRFYLVNNMTVEAANLSQQYEGLEYFAHGLEVLLHRVLDEEADTSPKPEEAVLPRVLSLLSSSKEYLDIVLQCTRKTEVRQWKTLFAYLPPAQELFEESLQRGSLKTAGGYLIILHTLDELDASLEQSVRVLSRAIREGDWELCKELARFLAAMDETGEILKEAMKMANVGLTQMSSQDNISSRLELPVTGLGFITNGRNKNGSDDGTGSDVRSHSDASSMGSTVSPLDG